MTCSNLTESTKGFRLLDALIDRYAMESSSKIDAKLMDKTVKLAALVQRTSVLLMTRSSGAFWLPSMTSVLYQSSKDGIDSVIQCLEWIDTDWNLIQLFVKCKSKATVRELMTVIDATGRNKEQSGPIKGAVNVLYNFRSRSVTRKNLIDTLKQLEKMDDKVERRQDKHLIKISKCLKDFVCSRLQSIAISEMAKSEAQVAWCQNLLSDVHQRYPVDTKLSVNYEHLVNFTKKKPSSWLQVQKNLLEFTRNKLGYDDVSSKNFDTILFELNHRSDIKAEQLDNYYDWAMKNNNNQLVEIIDKWFVQRLWLPKWDEIEEKRDDDSSNRRHKMRPALEWLRCRQPPVISYHHIMQLCIGDNLEFDKMFEDLEQMTTSQFIESFRQLASDVKKTPELASQIRRTLYIYEQVPFVETREVLEFEKLLQKMDADISRLKDDSLIRDWTDLKMEHRRTWAENYLRRWTDMRISNDKNYILEIDKIKTGLATKFGKTTVDIMLSKYLYLTSSHLSITQSFKHWSSLNDMKLTNEKELKKELERIFKGKY